MADPNLDRDSSGNGSRRRLVIVESPTKARKLAGYEAAGFGHLPVCIAKTQYSFSADATLTGAPEGHTLPVRDVRLSAGAGFVVVICGDIMSMPGLPRVPAAEKATRIGRSLHRECRSLRR